MRLELSGELKIAYDWIVYFQETEGRGTTVRELYVGTGLCDFFEEQVQTSVARDLRLLGLFEIERVLERFVEIDDDPSAALFDPDVAGLGYRVAHLADWNRV